MGAPSPWLTNFLASLQTQASPVRQPTTQELAASIIAKSNQYHYNLGPAKNYGFANVAATSASSASGKGKKGPSAIQRIFDVLSRPLYGTANLAKEGIKEARQGDIVGALEYAPIGAGAILHPGTFLEGLSGKKKTTSADVFKAGGLGKGHGVGGFARNLAGDLILDPLSYVPGGAISDIVRGGAKVGEAASATQRVEEALNSPKEVLARTSSKQGKNFAGETVGSKTPTTMRGMDLRAEKKLAQPGVTKTPIVRPGNAPVENLQDVPDLWKQILKTPGSGGSLPAAGARPISETTKKVLAKTISKPAPVTPFKLSQERIAGIEIARAVSPKLNNARGEFNAARKIIDSGGAVPTYSLSGNPIGELNAAKLHDYLVTGKVDAPKASEIPEFGNASEEEMQKFYDHLFADKNDPKQLYIKNVDENGNEELVTLANVRDRVRKISAARKLPKSIVEQTATHPIAHAEDLVQATGEGSKLAAKQLLDAVEKKAPRTAGKGVIDEAGGRAVATTAARYASLVKQATFLNATFNPAKQANAFRYLEEQLIKEGKLKNFNKIPPDKILTASTGKVATVRRSVAMDHLHALEDAMTEAGHPPVSFGKPPVPVRMSDLINAAGGIHAVLSSGAHLTDLFGTPEKFAKFLADHPEAAQLIENSRAADAVNTADLVDKGKTAALDATSKAELDPTLTPTEVEKARSEAPAVAADVVKAEANDGSDWSKYWSSVDNAAKMASDSVKELIKDARPPVDKVAQRYKAVFSDASFTGKITPKVNAGQTAKERLAIGIADVSPQDLKIEVSKEFNSQQAKSLVASLAEKFIPDFKQKDLRPIFDENRSVFQSNTANWSHVLNNVFKKYTPAQRLTAFKSLQRGTPVADEVTAQAALDMQKAMESMFGASGLKDAATTAVIRQAITAEDMNKWLEFTGSKFRFSKEVVDEAGKKVKVPWMDSWKYHNLQDEDPMLFIKRMRDATDRAMLEKTMFDQIALFGHSANIGGSTFAHPRLRGIAFDSNVAPQVSQFLKVMDDVAKPHGQFAATYDTALRAWKAGVTVYSPAHHVRNLVGDMFIAWLDGVNNPLLYKKAATVLKANRHMYSDMEQIDQLIGKDALTNATNRAATSKIVRVAGKDLDATQVYTIMYKRGLLPHSKVVEDIPGGRELGLPKPLGGRGQKVARQVSESREHYARIAHFIDVLNKYKGNSVDEAIQIATRRIRKWHPDGLGLTDFEHRWVRRVFPFYSWTRKAVPLMVEGAVKHPAKITAPSKAVYDLQIAMGLDPQSLSEPFPVNKQFPDWIRDMAYGPTMGAGQYIVGSNLNPFTSVAEQNVNHPRQGAAGMLTPFLRVPGELLSQKDWQTGQDMSTMDKTEYIDKQVPVLSAVDRLTNSDLGAGGVEAAVTGNASALRNHKINQGTAGNTAGRDAFLNWLLAAGIINTQTPSNQKSAQYDQKARISAANKAAAAKP